MKVLRADRSLLGVFAMSRIGKKPVAVPAGVKVEIRDREVTVKGPAGELKLRLHEKMAVEFDSAGSLIRVSRPDDRRDSRALHGLTRSLIQNMVTGVVKPFEKRLEIVGVGYNASLSAGQLVLQVGYANKVTLKVPQGVTCEVPDATHVVVKSADRHAVGQFAADVRAVRPPEPFKGKGVRYQGEYVRRKSGKAFGSK